MRFINGLIRRTWFFFRSEARTRQEYLIISGAGGVATGVANSWFLPSRNVGNVGNVRNLVNVGRWRNGRTLCTLRENMETKLYQRFLLVNRYGVYVKNRNRFYSYIFHVYVTFCRIRENVYVKIFTYTWFSTLRTLTTYVTWRRKSRVSDGNGN